jgi:hypothetical protein
VRFDSLGTADVHGVGWNQTGAGERESRTSVDEWGCLWVRTEEVNMGQVKGHPLLDWERADSYDWPNPDNPSLYAGMEDRFVGAGGKYVLTGIFMLLFERMHALHGFQNTLEDLYLNRSSMDELADRIVQFDLGIMANIARRFPGQIHGFSFTDDWGSQQATFIRPALWDEFFRPRYRQLFDAAHAAGWHVWMHSCGRINDLLEGLIDIGLDVINLQQPRALGIEEIGRRFAGKVCFESLCDIQHTLPMLDEEAVRGEAGLLLEHWATPNGGFILSDYGDGRAIGVEAERKRHMLDAFLAADPWRSRSSEPGGQAPSSG